MSAKWPWQVPQPHGAAGCPSVKRRRSLCPGPRRRVVAQAREACRDHSEDHSGPGMLESLSGQACHWEQGRDGGAGIEGRG